jgi:hypothetical protein
MPIALNHTIVPTHDKEAAAKFFAGIFGLPFEGASGHFASVHVNDTLTLLFNQATGFDTHHLGSMSMMARSMPSSAASRRRACATAVRPSARMTASSMIGTAAAACTSKTPMATSSS